MSLKHAYLEKMDAVVEEQQARLALLKAQAKRTMADGKIIAYEELADADRKLEVLRARMRHLTQTGGELVGELRLGVEKALDDLGSACRNAAAKLNVKS